MYLAHISSFKLLIRHQHEHPEEERYRQEAILQGMP